MLAETATLNARECKYNNSLSPPAGPPHHAVAMTAIEITMATERLPESKAVEKLEEEGWRDRGRENEKEGWGLS